MEKKEKSNVCGIIGIIASLLSPIVGIILGIIALARGEKTPALGILAIVIGVINAIWGIVLISG